MDKHQRTSVNFYIHTAWAGPWGHVIKACWLCIMQGWKLKDTELLRWKFQDFTGALPWCGHQQNSNQVCFFDFFNGEDEELNDCTFYIYSTTVCRLAICWLCLLFVVVKIVWSRSELLFHKQPSGCESDADEECEPEHKQETCRPLNQNNEANDTKTEVKCRVRYYFLIRYIIHNITQTLT